MERGTGNAGATVAKSVEKRQRRDNGDVGKRISEEGGGEDLAVSVTEATRSGRFFDVTSARGSNFKRGR